MAKYLISFPSAAMIVPDGDWEAVVRDSHVVIAEAKAAGVYVFGGGIDEGVPPALVSADGKVVQGGYPWARPLNGGFYRARITLTRGGGHVGRAPREGLPLRPRATRLRVRPGVLSRCRSVAQIEYEERAEPCAAAPPRRAVGRCG